MTALPSCLIAAQANLRQAQVKRETRPALWTDDYNNSLRILK
jgi:hypothetical protein